MNKTYITFGTPETGSIKYQTLEDMICENADYFVERDYLADLEQEGNEEKILSIIGGNTPKEMFDIASKFYWSQSPQTTSADVLLMKSRCYLMYKLICELETMRNKNAAQVFIYSKLAAIEAALTYCD